jgi:hypothetical protein
MKQQARIVCKDLWDELGPREDTYKRTNEIEQTDTAHDTNTSMTYYTQRASLLSLLLLLLLLFFFPHGSSQKPATAAQALGRS